MTSHADLTRDLDKVKSAVFLSSNAAFLGSLMCTLKFVWDTSIETAGTDGLSIYWNPDFFKSIPREARETVLLHELWHVARLHGIRRGTRDPEQWNIACDIRINNDLIKDRRSFIGIEDCHKDPDIDKKGVMTEEDIYDQLPPPPPTAKPVWGDGDIMDDQGNADVHAAAVINNVVQAVQQAKMSGQPGTVPGDIEAMLAKFLEPVIPWQSVLKKFFTDLLEEDYSWKRPNRRHQDIYLPSRYTDEGKLAHLVYFFDVSASVTDSQVTRFNSEVKYIWDEIQPEKLTVIQFDTRIQDVKVFTEGDDFSGIKVHGRGGTCLVEVRQWIIDNNPTAAIVFSDMWVAPMEPLPREIPIIWAIIGNPRVTPPFGKAIHIPDED